MDDYFVPFEKRPKMNFSICTKYDSQFSSYKGIYLIKIGDEYYVGKTNSTFGRRFSDHRVLIKKYLQDIETTGSYKETFTSGRWDGKHLYSKFVMAMTQNNIKIEQIEFFVIEFQKEKYDDKFLMTRENYYIEHFKSYIYGMNQIGITILAHEILYKFIYRGIKLTKSDLEEYKERFILDEKKFVNFLKQIYEKHLFIYKWVRFNIRNGINFYRRLLEFGFNKFQRYEDEISDFKELFSNI